MGDRWEEGKLCGGDLTLSRPTVSPLRTPWPQASGRTRVYKAVGGWWLEVLTLTAHQVSLKEDQLNQRLRGSPCDWNGTSVETLISEVTLGGPSAGVCATPPSQDGRKHPGSSKGSRRQPADSLQSLIRWDVAIRGLSESPRLLVTSSQLAPEAADARLSPAKPRDPLHFLRSETDRNGVSSSSERAAGSEGWLREGPVTPTSHSFLLRSPQSPPRSPPRSPPTPRSGHFLPGL